MIKKLRCILLWSFLLPATAMAQKDYLPVGDKKIAEQLFLYGDYVTSLKEYQYLYEHDSANTDYWFPLAFCYLYTDINKLKSIPLLEKVVNMKTADYAAWYHLGLAYQIAYRFDDAIDCFKKFKSFLKGTDKNIVPADRCIEMCENAKELIEKPVNVTFENLGEKINSRYPDYSPFINKNETVLYYSSKRFGNLGGMLDYDGYYTSDIYSSEIKYGLWQKCKRMAPIINTAMPEETAGLSADGSHLFVFVDRLEAPMQTMVSVKSGKNFQMLKPMGENINPVNNGANAVTVTPDKKIAFFSSVREGGQGGSDLYMAKLLPSGQYGPAENLGQTINTKYDEDFPFLTVDGKTLYFASAGHNSMGGLDIFRSDWDSETNTFSEPVNIGYPVNTPEDNTTICFTGSGRYAYISALRKEGIGNLDIYRVIFNDVKAGYTALKGTLVTKDSVNIYADFRKAMQKDCDSLKALTDPTYIKANKITETENQSNQAKLKAANYKLENGPDVKILVYNSKDMSLTGTYKPNAETGKFIVVLTPGSYVLTITCDGYEEFKETIKIEDREMPVKEIVRSFKLTKKS